MIGFGSIWVGGKKGGYLIVGSEFNEGMGSDMGTLSPLSTWAFLIMVIFLTGRELSFLLPIFSFSHTRQQMYMPLAAQYLLLLPIFTTGNTVSDFYSIDRVSESKNVFTSSGDLDTLQSTVKQLPTWEKNNRLYGLLFPPSQPIPSPALTRRMHI